MVQTSSTTIDSRTTTIQLTTPGELLSTPACASSSPTAVVATAADADRPRQLSALDLQLLDTETDSTPLHIGSIIMLDSAATTCAPLTVTSLRRLFAARIHLLAPLRRRVRTVLLGLDQPYWEDCDTIDLGYHVRAVTLADGATDNDLADYVARHHAQPLDRHRPLWECHLVSGLPFGRQAVYTKVHHAVIDGVSAAEIMAAILDITDSPAAPASADAEIRRDRMPSTTGMLARSVPNAFARQSNRVRAVRQAVPALLHAHRDLRTKHPDVPFNRAISPNRSVAFTSLPLDAVKAVKKSVDGTVNDIVMALCTAALRRWMADHALAADRPLLAAVPVSVRTPEQFGTAGNQFSIMLSQLPVHESEPHARLLRLRDALRAGKEQFHRQPPTLLHEITSLLTPVLSGLPTRALLRAATPALPLTNLIVSNVAGPQIPLYLNGIRVLASYPVSVLTELAGNLNITVMSYDGHLDFGILACSDGVPDIWDLARYLHDALTELEQQPQT